MFVPCPHHARTHRRINSDISTRARASLNCRRDPLPPDLGQVVCFHASRLGLIALIFSRDRCLVHCNLRIQISSAFVNLQTFVTFTIVLHLLANPLSALFRAMCCCLPMNSNVRTRRASDRHTILSQVCPRDVAPTWRQRQMDNLRSWDLNSLCSFCSSFGNISKETTKRIATE